MKGKGKGLFLDVVTKTLCISHKIVIVVSFKQNQTNFGFVIKYSNSIPYSLARSEVK